MNVFIRTLTLLFICSLVLCQGCKTSKKKRFDSTYGDENLSLPFEVKGRVNGASVLNSSSIVTSVSLHPVIGGRAALFESAATAEANNFGDYALTIAPEYRGKPGFIKAVVSDSTQPEVEALVLLLAVPELSPVFTNNITGLTTVAARKLQSRQSLGSSSQAAIAISDVNSQVAGRFGVIGDLASLPVVNTNRFEQLSASSITSIRYSAMGQAIIVAFQADNPGLSPNQALVQFSERFAVNGMVDNAGANDDTSYSEILNSLIVFIRSMTPKDGSAPVLDRLLIELSTEISLAQLGEPEDYDPGSTASSVGLSYVEKARAMVQDMRQVVASIDVQSIASLVNITKLLANDNPISDKFEGFGIQVNLSELVSGDDFDHITSALKAIGLAVVDRLACDKQGTCEQQPPEIRMEHTVEDISQSVQRRRELHTFTIKQTLNACVDAPIQCLVDADLEIVLDVTRLSFTLDVDGGVSGVLADEAIITIDGLLNQSDLVLNLEPKAPQITFGKIEVGFEVDESLYPARDITYIEVKSPATIDLPFTLNRENAAGRQDMNATLDASVDSLSLELVDTVETAYSGRRSTTTKTSETRVFQLEGLKLNMFGVVNNLSDENFLVSINAAQSGLGFLGDVVYRQWTIEDCQILSDPETCEQTVSETVFEGESAELNFDGSHQFIKLDVSVGYKAILKGVADPVMVKFSASRDTPDQAIINGLRVSYPGHSLSLNGTFTNRGFIRSMEATNLDGIVMSIETPDGGKLFGEIRGANGEKLANIIQRTDLLDIEYTDGVFAAF